MVVMKSVEKKIKYAQTFQVAQYDVIIQQFALWIHGESRVK